MTPLMLKSTTRLFYFLMLLSTSANAQIKVAVASNFKTTLIEITKIYKQETGNTVLISSASTGTLFNQIKYGAPFDLFLSADSERAKLIEESKAGIKGTRFTYAKGQLAFWIPKSTSQVTESSLNNYSDRLAIANPNLAPYGLATKESLTSMNLWNKNKYVQGANIAQTYQFIDSGNINAGFVAYVLIKNRPTEQSYLIPDSLHDPIKQQGVIIAKTKQLDETKEFVSFLTSPKTQEFIQQKGYL